MRIVGILAAYNEELVIEACLRHHIDQGIELLLIDNGSTDGTVPIAQRYLGHGLIGIETLPRRGVVEWERVLQTKQTLAWTLDADWLMHLDADEMRLASTPGMTLSQAIRVVDEAGYNAVNFVEFTFVPTREAPDHAHVQFQDTMRWYYPYVKKSLHQVKLWKKQPTPVDLVSRGGHQVWFPNQFIYPIPFWMRHYQFLSIVHAAQKYGQRRHLVKELAKGWHGWREQLDPTTISLPSCAELNELATDGSLDFSRPRSVHILAMGSSGQSAPDHQLPGLSRKGHRLGEFFRRFAR